MSRTKDGKTVSGHVIVECVGKNGKVKWREEGENLIVDKGLNWILENDIAAATLYVGLKDTGTVLSTWVMTDITELTIYDEATRVAFTENATADDEAVSNSASPAAFTMNATDSIVGAFLTNFATKSDTASSTLIGAKDFGSPQAVDSGDTLNVTYTIDATSS